MATTNDDGTGRSYDAKSAHLLILRTARFTHRAFHLLRRAFHFPAALFISSDALFIPHRVFTYHVLNLSFPVTLAVPCQ